MLPEQQQRILGYFIEEAKDHLNTLEQGLLTLQGTINDRELLKEVYRAAHSVKGGAGMLSLQSIQKTSHLLEDCFKLLEESPVQVQVDQKLESLFWRVFDALKELLEQLQGPFGLTEDVAANLMASVEPVSNELRQHLEKLVTASAGKVTATKQRDSQQELLMSTFKQEVMEQLRQMLQLFKSPAWPNSRTQLEGCCDSLAQMGNTFELSAWCSLMETAKIAIANPENTCQTLAPVVIKEIKAAQELVLTGKAAQICIGDQLQALLPVTLPAEELDFDDIFLEEPLASNEDSFYGATPDSEVDADLFAEPLEISEPEPLTTGSNFGRSGKTARSIADHTPRMDLSETENNPRFTDPHGPEVGAAELNTLADLFQEAVDFDERWQEEETVGDVTVEPTGLDIDTNLETDSDFADLFDDIYSEGQATAEDPLGFLSDDFEEEIFSVSPADLTGIGLDDNDDIFAEKISLESADNLTELFADLPEEDGHWEELPEVAEANLAAPIDQFDSAGIEELTDLFDEPTTETATSWGEDFTAPLEAGNLDSDDSWELLGLEAEADFDWEAETPEATTANDFNPGSQTEAEFDLANLFGDEDDLLNFDEESSITSESEVTEAALTDDFGFGDNSNEWLNAEVTEDGSLANTLDFGASTDEFWSEETPATASATVEELDENWFAETELFSDGLTPNESDLSATAAESDLFSDGIADAQLDTSAQLTDLESEELGDLAFENNEEIPVAAEDLSFDGNWDLMEWENSPATPVAETDNTLLDDVFDPFALDTSASNQISDEQFAWDFNQTADSAGSLDDLFDLGTEDLGNLAAESTDFSDDLFGVDSFTESTNFASTANVLPEDEYTTTHIQDFDNEIGAYIAEEPGMEWLTDTSTEESLEMFEPTAPTAEESLDFGSFDAELTADSEFAADDFLADVSGDDGFDWGAELTEEIPETAEATDWQDLAELPTDDAFDFDGLTAQTPEDLALSTDDAFDFDGLTAQAPEDLALSTDDAFDFDGLTAQAP
ncbi:MAG TPA: Hpt domain-containing protein, partial [Phormidium sp.]